MAANARSVGVRKAERVRDQRSEVQQQSRQMYNGRVWCWKIATPVDTERQKQVFFVPDVGQRRVSSHGERVGAQVAILAWKGAMACTHWVLVNVQPLAARGMDPLHATPPSGMLVLVPHSHHKQIPFAVSGPFQ